MSEFKGKTEKELSKLLSDKQEAVRAFRFGLAGSKVKNLKEGRTIKRDIARIMTELTAQKISLATPTPKA